MVPAYRPQLALLVKAPPAGDAWVHELKLDGYRIGCRIVQGKVALFSRRNKEWTAEFPELVTGAKRLKVKSALLDGELAAVLPDGRTSLQALGSAPLAYFAFDLIHLDGEDLTGLPLLERKTRLRALLGRRPPRPFRYVDHVVGGGDRFFADACGMGLEGIVSKLAASPYRPGARNASWQKVKCVLRQEFVIGGFAPSVLGGLGALWLGYYDAEGRLVFAGKVGTGFQRQEQKLLKTMKKLVADRPPFEVGLPTGYRIRDVSWLSPRLVCEVAFMEWTGHGHIRHPSFQGLRADKKPRDVVREVAAPAFEA